MCTMVGNVESVVVVVFFFPIHVDTWTTALSPRSCGQMYLHLFIECDQLLLILKLLRLLLLLLFSLLLPCFVLYRTRSFHAMHTQRQQFLYSPPLHKMPLNTPSCPYPNAIKYINYRNWIALLASQISINNASNVSACVSIAVYFQQQYARIGGKFA